MRLKDRVAVVVGASHGIGAAVARRFSAEGARLVLGARSEAEVLRVAKDCRDALGLPLDVRDPASVTSFANAVRERYGGVDILVSNAGVGIPKPVEAMTTEEWDTVLSTNLRGAFLVAKAFIPLLVKERPWPRTVIHTASVSGTMGMAGLSAYVASKWGLRGFSQSLALELAPRGVRVVCVNPGYVATSMTEDARAQKEDMIQPEELAEYYVQLATMPASLQVDDVTVWPHRLYST